MRLHEVILLLEYNKEATLKNWAQRLGEAGKFNWKHLGDYWWETFQDSIGVGYEEFYKINSDPVEANIGVAEAVLNEIEKMDPTPNKQYVQILVRWYVGVIQANKELQQSWESYIMQEYPDMYDSYIDWSHEEGLHNEYDDELYADYVETMEPFLITPENLDTFKLEDADQITQTLNNFIRIKNQLPVQERDIGRFESFYEFEDFVDDRMDPEVQQEIDNELLDRPDIRVLYNGPLGTVAVPRTHEASCVLGRGTKWCTAAKSGPANFDGYSREGDLIIYNEKPGNAKYQFHVTDDNIVVADSRDRFLHGEDKQKYISKHPVMSKILKNYRDTMEERKFEDLSNLPVNKNRDLASQLKDVAGLVMLNQKYKKSRIPKADQFFAELYSTEQIKSLAKLKRTDIGKTFLKTDWKKQLGSFDAIYRRLQGYGDHLSIQQKAPQATLPVVEMLIQYMTQRKPQWVQMETQLISMLTYLSSNVGNRIHAERLAKAMMPYANLNSGFKQKLTQWQNSLNKEQ